MASIEAFLIFLRGKHMIPTFRTVSEALYILYTNLIDAIVVRSDLTWSG